MHGLALRAAQLFLIDIYGAECWNGIIRASGLPVSEFEAMLSYDDSTALALLDAIESELDRDLPETLEDLGTYLVSNPRLEALRRLLRFGGVSFEEFILSLEDLRDRTRLAVPDLDLPEIELSAQSKSVFVLRCKSPMKGYVHVLVGLLRAMADDYGALALVEHIGASPGGETVTVTLLESTFAEGREFKLGAQV